MNSEKIKLKCIDISEDGKGIVKLNNTKFYIPHLIKDELANLDFFHTKKSLNAKLLSVENPSKYRVNPKCPSYYKCGSCQLQHMSYEGQLLFKQDTVNKLLSSLGKVNKIIGMDTPYNYRNKIHSTLSYNGKGKIISGLYEENTHNVINVDKCIIQHNKSDEIIKTIRKLMEDFKIKPYNEDTGVGLIRHILIKVGFTSKQIMLVLVTASPVFPSKNDFIKELLKIHPEITTILLNVNKRRTSLILDDNEKVIYGKGYIEDTLCGCTFQISAKSFYQINPIQTEKLYNQAIDMARLDGNEIVIDTYCGIGTISLIVSKKVKKVIGVEINKDAVRDAIQNAKRNNITNTFFYNSDSGEFMKNMTVKKEQVDVVFMDPPRSGSDEKFLNSLTLLGPKKIIYISCNPITLERDLRYLLARKYKINSIQPVDMFPQTNHIECIVSLEK